MKKVLSALLVALFSVMGVYAQQVTVPEPEFADQAYLLTSNSTYVKLPRESGAIKTKAGASLYLVGIGKVKTRLTLEGKESPVKTTAGETRIILRAKDNLTDPESFISVFKFEINGKNRRAQIAEDGTFSAAKTNSLSQISYQAEKYGESSYLLHFDSLQPGEYGISLGDPNADSNKNGYKVTTFSVQ
ncbi:MAG: hypothetical protein K6A82_06575 [Prevotella sp.]|nr:hypothetical protein [Prevotella sp.]